MKNTLLTMAILASFSGLADAKQGDSYISATIGKQHSEGAEKLNNNIYSVNGYAAEFDIENNVPVLKGAYGYDYTDNFGLELRAQYSKYNGKFGVANSNSYVIGDIEGHVFNYGSYVVARLPLEEFSLFAKAGLVGSYVKIETAFGSETDTTFGYGYSIGADYSINKDWKFLVEYDVIEPDHKNKGHELTSINMGFARYF